MSTITVTAGLQPHRAARPVSPVSPVRSASSGRRARSVLSASSASASSASASSARPAPATPLRLTRRGRLLVTALTFLALVTAGVVAAGGVPAVAGSESGTAATAQRVTVRPGDTLWVIAERVAPGVDPRDTVAEIMDLNALESSSVAAGSVLLLPPR